MAEGEGDTSRFLYVDGKAAAYFASCGSKSFATLLKEQLDASADKDASSSDSDGGRSTTGVAAPSPKRRSPKKVKVF